jgi:pimeloyl-ACP methyl ester carboxylesterase
MGRSIRPEPGLDLPGLARAVIAYCDAVGVQRPILVGNSLGCPIIVEVANLFPDRIERAVLVSPAGGPNNQPLGRAIAQMATDGFRELPSMLPIAARDYLRFGLRDPLVRIANAPRLAVLPHVDAVTVPGAHALNYSDPRLIAELIEAFITGEPLATETGLRTVVRMVSVDDS